MAKQVAETSVAIRLEQFRRAIKPLYEQAVAELIAKQEQAAQQQEASVGSNNQ